METKLSDELSHQIAEGVAVLKHGGLVAYPTDTVYGLGASLNFETAIKRIYTVKKRSEFLPFPLLVANITQIADVAINIPPLAWLLAARFLPGALTLVLYRSRRVPAAVTGGSDKVGVRVPANPVPIALIHGSGAPLIGTSANLNGQPSALTAVEVRQQIGTEVDYIIDGGRVTGGVGSTVIDVTRERPLILRVGAISKRQIEEKTRDFDPALEFLVNS